MNQIAEALEEAAQVVADNADEIFEDLCDFEKQGPTAATGSDVDTWTAVISDWRCSYEPAGSTAGARDGAFQTASPSGAYRFTGPVIVDGELIEPLKTYRLKLQERGRQPVRYFTINSISIEQGVFLTVSATLND